ncbi:hypothetical protein [Desulfosporosinus lacus]|uniref:Peptidase propeptide and YPEB domain-containing protein n=1 Tax=Desulfosporosinus lacus DSM 15449 TaxID=1121420 RepID=A0A1M5YL50_9FIRM|nr:hypothetical protein [Desulfosporosinus lacus]SHI12554.1 hypothetical protein SAMN02746098_02505 [Desulfosporosinus lacus DSM 15449]
MIKFIKVSIVIVITLSLVGTISLIKPRNSSANTTYLLGVKPVTSQNLASLSKIGYEFNVPALPAVISPDVAIRNASVTYPGLKGKTDYTVEYQVLTVPKFNAFSQEALEKNPVLNAKKLIDHLPVYIISYENMLIPVHSPIGTKSSETQDSSVPAGYQKGEYNVVVDATSGVPLLVFSYR